MTDAALAFEATADTKCVSSQGAALVEQGIAVGMSAPNNKLRRQSRFS